LLGNWLNDVFSLQPSVDDIINHLLIVKKTTILAIVAKNDFPHRNGSVLVSRVLVRDRPLVPATLALGQPDSVLCVA
jgi:hypothetical protein